MVVGRPDSLNFEGVRSDGTLERVRKDRLVGVNKSRRYRDPRRGVRKGQGRGIRGNEDWYRTVDPERGENGRGLHGVDSF